nr:PREDICTED: putative RNA-binding protein 15B [Bos mutus]
MRELEEKGLKAWEDTWKRRGLSSDRGRATHSPYEERSRTKGGGQPADRGSDRTPEHSHKENRSSEGTKESGSNSLSNSRHGAEERSHHHHHEAPDSSHGKKTRESERNHRTTEAEPKPLEEPKHETKKLKNLSEYAQTLQLGWNGLLELKNSCFPTSLHLLEGDQGVEPGLQRQLLRNLVSYLKQKQAAGVISLPVGGSKGRDSTGMLYAFPPCDFSQQYLQSALRTLGKLEEEHMVIVIHDGPFPVLGFFTFCF